MKKLLILFALVAFFIIGGNHDTAFALSNNSSDYTTSFRTESGNTRDSVLSLNFDFSNCYVIHGLGPGGGAAGFYQYRWIFINSASPYYIGIKSLNSPIEVHPYIYFDYQAEVISVTAEFKNPIHTSTVGYNPQNISIALNYINNNVIDSSCEEISCEYKKWIAYDSTPNNLLYKTNTPFFINSNQTFYQTSIGRPQCIVGRTPENLFEYLNTGNNESILLWYNGILRTTYMPGAKANVIGVTNTMAWSANSNIQNAQDNLYPYGNKWQIRIDNVNPNAKYRFVYKIACPILSYINALKTTVAQDGLFSDNYFLELDENNYPYFYLPSSGYLYSNLNYRFRTPLNSSVGNNFGEVSDSFSVEVLGSAIPDGRINIDLSAVIESRTLFRNLYGNDIKAASVLAYITDVWTYVTEIDYESNRSWYGDINVYRASFQDFPKNPNYFITANNEYSNPIPPVATKIENPNNTINDGNIESIVNYPTENPDNDPTDPSYNANYGNINNTTNQDLTNAQQNQINDITSGQYNQFDQWFQNVTNPDTDINTGVFQSVSDLALSASKLSDVVRNFLSFLPPEIMSMILAIFVVTVPVIVIKLFM